MLSIIEIAPLLFARLVPIEGHRRARQSDPTVPPKQDSPLRLGRNDLEGLGDCHRSRPIGYLARAFKHRLGRGWTPNLASGPDFKMAFAINGSVDASATRFPHRVPRDRRQGSWPGRRRGLWLRFLAATEIARTGRLLAKSRCAAGLPPLQMFRLSAQKALGVPAPIFAKLWRRSPLARMPRR